MYFHLFNKSRKCRLFIFLPVLVFISLSSVTASGIQATVMRNIFHMPDAETKMALKPYLEIMWDINPESVAFSKENEAWKGKVKTDIIISGEKGIVQEEHYILETLPVSEQYLTLSQTIIDLKRYLLPEGKITVRLKFTDLNRKGNEFNYIDSFSVTTPSGQPFFSDVQIVDTSFVSSEQNIFQRNGRIQIPLAVNFLNEERKSLHYYAELYNTHKISEEQLPLVRKVYISKREFDLPLHRLMKIDTVASSLLQITGGTFSVATLPSGNYYLNVLVHDKDQQHIASKALFFQLLNEKPADFAAPTTADTATAKEPTSYLNLNKTFVAKFTSPQVRAILKMLIPIAGPAERATINDFLKRPDDVYSRYFVYNFWLGRNRLNPEKEWKDYAEKVKEVNKLFGSSLLPGYETERGVIYLKYGKPGERVTVANENGALPYEVWYYNELPQNVNAVFLFYRPGMVTNDYRLLHSTVNGEMRNKNWRSILYLNEGGDNVSNNSRAEQYIGNR